MKTKLLIFGITGDLGTRKLLPALEQIISTGDFDDLSIVGVSRREISIDELLVSCEKPDVLKDKISTYTMDLSELSDYQQLKEYISLTDDEQLLIYLSVPPQTVAGIVEHLGETGLNTPNIKILFEKPFGVDLESAKQVAEHASKYYDETQIYRIDHYLAKEMAQNLVAIRGKNALFSNIWNNQFIESIEIVATETIGIEGRASFYEHTGALRDVVQGHLMQLLALTLADIPADFNWDKLPSLRLAALDHLQPADPEKVVRGQYDGYLNEIGKSESCVETFVSIDLVSDHPNWQGVPIRLITGKALDKKTTDIRVHLKRVNEAQSNCLAFRIHPNESIDIQLFVKKPGYSNDLESRHLGFNYPDDTKLPDAYEQVIVDAISSRKSLFTSGEEVIQSWRILQPIQDKWYKACQIPVIYPIGSNVESVLA